MPDLMSLSLVALGAAALLVRVGLALYLAGSSRSKNAAGAVLRTVCDLCAATLAFWAVGAAVLFQSDNPIFSLDFSATHGDPRALAAVFFNAVVVTVATGPLAGAMAERSRFFVPAGASVLLAALVVPVAGNWAQRGWLHNMGFIDAAGASWIHVVAGVFAAVGARAVGPRLNKYHRDGSASVIPGHSVPLIAIGTLLIFVAWIPYVAGCVLGLSMDLASVHRAALNVLLAGAAGGMAALLLGQLRYGKPDVLLTLIGLLGALVSITAGAGAVPPHGAVLIGLVGGLIVPLASIHIDLIVRIDDSTAAVAVHAVGGAWGTLAAGLFAPGSFVERLKHLGVQSLGLLAIAVLAAACAFGLFAVLGRTIGLRSKEADEFDGLDLAEHDIGAYPDFQQNTIRSFHLREA